MNALATHLKVELAQLLADYRLLLMRQCEADRPDLATSFDAFAREAVKARLPLHDLVSTHGAVVAEIRGRTGDDPQASQVADRVLKYVLTRFDTALADSRQSQEELQREVVERRRIETELERTNTRLEEQTKELSAFIYAISHDLKSPVHAIQLLLDMFLRDFRTTDMELQLIDTAGATARRMRAMLDDLVDFCKTLSTDDREEDVGLDDLIDDLLGDLSEEIGIARAQIDKDALPVVRGKRYQIRLLFMNLLTNALKFRQADQPAQIRIACDPPNDGRSVRIRVSDRGIGVPSAHQDKIFGLFHRLHARDRYPGSGIGLAICRRVVDNHGGSISLTSREGDGTTVEMTLPKPTSSR